MNLIGRRKLTWGICAVSILLAVISVFFLPQMIPVHFANGTANDFGTKFSILLFPFLSLVITLLTGIEGVKYTLTHSKLFLNDIQYNLMIDGVLALVLAVEVYIVYASFH